ncbi:MAG TPA: hypothetical protein VJT09_04335 [Pyrinomonadaceae bacterium]|nr:hypothetical protein [Pyrinomonadaceae bacterium]
MASPTLPQTRKLTIIAQDPSIKVRSKRGQAQKILKAEVEIPNELFAPGPTGYRVQVFDYDASTDTLYKPFEHNLRDEPQSGRLAPDPIRDASDAQLLSDPRLHALNAYAIVMSTLARFEFALGRRISWGFYSHQIRVAPHAFADANAFYSERDQALLFGYFPAPDGKMVFSCLSHDVVAHETTHALVDGLREHFTDPSSPEQAAFHEGFADVVALLSVFSLTNVVDALLDLNSQGSNRIASSKLGAASLRDSMLLGLAEQMGTEMTGVRGHALRRSVNLKPSPDYIKQKAFLAPHRRGEIFVAAMMQAFIEVWVQRLKGMGLLTEKYLDRQRVVEEGAGAANLLLTMSIRALDYTPPVHLEFCDFLSAMLTADRELRPDRESKYGYRDILLKNFKAYGMMPATKNKEPEEGVWKQLRRTLVYNQTHFESMQRDPDEVFRFIWENREALELYQDAYSHVISVRPCLRVAPDGFTLRETVVEFIQTLELKASQLKALKISVPKGMPDKQDVRLYGGNTLIFDEYGRLKYNIHNRLDNATRQSRRVKFLWEYGFFDPSEAGVRRFSSMHRQRALNFVSRRSEEW